MEKYYVVKRGFKPGIYKTWNECKTAVDGYVNPVFRKFESFQEANEFYKNESSTTSSTASTTASTSKPFSASGTNKNQSSKDSSLCKATTTSSSDMTKIKSMTTNIKSSQYSDDLNYNVSGWNIIEDEIYLFTDGSSRKSKDYFNSGIGVYIGYNCTNIKEQYNNKTNNQCELMAMDYAFKLIVRYFRELTTMKKIIKIVSDSEYSIKACSVWLPAWKKNNWKTAKGEDVKNRDIIESIEGNMMRIKIINSKLDADSKIRVKLIHVNSHQAPDTQDKFKFSIWFGNYVADGLAQNSM
jgi:ribonuclease HI